MSASVKYRLYPSLLNSFQLLLSGSDWVSEQSLLDSINRLPTPTTEAQQAGTDFETAVLVAHATGTHACNDEPSVYDLLVAEVAGRLPTHLIAQHRVSRAWEDIEFYGIVDCLGEGRVVDIKTTKSYKLGKFKDSHQNLYLWAAEKWGIRQMDYLCVEWGTDAALHQETYHAHNYPFNDRFLEMREFTRWLETYRHRIYDPKIFA